MHSYVHSSMDLVLHIFARFFSLLFFSVLLDFNSANPFEYKDNMITAVSAENNGLVLVLYNGLIIHSAPIALNTYTNALILASDPHHNHSMKVTTQTLFSSQVRFRDSEKFIHSKIVVSYYGEKVIQH